MHYQSWCSLSDDELGKRDIAEVNLASAFGLPHAGNLDIPGLREKLDHWADCIREATKRAFRKRRETRTYPEYSAAEFRMFVLMTALYRNLGVRYNVPFSHGEYDATDSRNLFIHGPLTGHGGTCVTMPVLVAALGRRLGYPLKLVFANQHTFCRWAGDGERFNIETTSPGFNPRPDQHYLTWPFPISQREIDKGWYLRNLTPREELAYFLAQRANCLTDHLQSRRAVEAAYHAAHLAPRNENYHYFWGTTIIMHRAVEQLRKHQVALQLDECRIAMPAPKEDWEKRMYPEVESSLRRILANAKRKRAAKPQPAFV